MSEDKRPKSGNWHSGSTRDEPLAHADFPDLKSVLNPVGPNPRTRPALHASLKVDDGKYLAAAGYRYLALQRQKRAYLSMQTIFLILSFVYLYSKCRDITAGWGTTGWLLTAGMVLFLLRWVLNTEREWAQLGCGAGALFMVFAWFIGLSLLDIYSAGPSITTPPGLPPPPPQPPLTQPVAPVTWVACAVQAALSVWLAWILARDVGSRRRVAG